MNLLKRFYDFLTSTKKDQTEICRYCDKPIKENHNIYCCVAWSPDDIWISKNKNESNYRFHADCIKENEAHFNENDWDDKGHQNIKF